MSALHQAVISAIGAAAPWHPSDLFQNSELGGAWDATDVTKLYTDAGTTLSTADDDAIQRLADVSGTGVHMEQATSGLRPLRKTNGVSHLQSDGVDDWLLSSSTFTVSPPWTILASVRPLSTTGTGSRTIAALIKASSTDYVGVSRRGDNDKARANARRASGTVYMFEEATGTLVDGTDVVCEMQFTENDVKHLIDGSVAVEGTIDFATAATMTTTYVTAMGAITGAYEAMRLYRMIAVNRVLTAGEQTEARAWCAAGFSGAT